MARSANSDGDRLLYRAVRSWNQSADDWDQDDDDWRMSASPWGNDDPDWRMSRVSAVPTALGRSDIVEPGRRVVAMGWHRDPPEFRDFCILWRKPRTTGKKSLINGDNEVTEWLTKKKSGLLAQAVPTPTGSHYENLKFCSPVEDQGAIGSCTAQAVVGLMEYNMRRGSGTHVDGSRLFVYKVTRKLMGVTGDQGGYLRTAMKAVATFGVPPEKHWAYDISRFDEEPDPFVYTYATNFKAMKYARLDGPGVEGEELLGVLKRALKAGHCAVFGFQVFSSLSGAPDIPFPSDSDEAKGGHAVMAVGFDDGRKNVNTTNDGALIIRNSWGNGWGAGGYGYLPYDYLRQGLCSDFWSAFTWDWINSNKFE